MLRKLTHQDMFATHKVTQFLRRKCFIGPVCNDGDAGIIGIRDIPRGIFVVALLDALLEFEKNAEILLKLIAKTQ